MVHADSYGGVVLPAYLQERQEAFLYLLQFGGIFLIGILQVAEGACRVYIVARVDSHLLGIEGGHIGHMGVEVHIGHERCHDALCPEAGIDEPQVLGLAHPLCGEPYILAAGPDDAPGLCYAPLGVEGGRGGHRLHAYGPGAS